MDNTESLIFRVIGKIKSSYIKQAGTPIQPHLKKSADAEIHIKEEYREGLADLESFDRIWALTLLDRAKEYKMKVIPYRDTTERGLFATRAPSRPNNIGLSCVRLVSVNKTDGIIKVQGIDFLNETPVLDIKPYVPEFDSFPESSAGWLNNTNIRKYADARFGNK